MGAAVDLQNEGLRRLLVNACYWGLGLEDRTPPKNNVDIVGTYEPLNFGFGSIARASNPRDQIAGCARLLMRRIQRSRAWKWTCPAGAVAPTRREAGFLPGKASVELLKFFAHGNDPVVLLGLSSWYTQMSPVLGL